MGRIGFLSYCNAHVGVTRALQLNRLDVVVTVAPRDRMIHETHQQIDGMNLS